MHTRWGTPATQLYHNLASPSHNSNNKTLLQRKRLQLTTSYLSTLSLSNSNNKAPLFTSSSILSRVVAHSRGASTTTTTNSSSGSKELTILQ
jgi:hypothetical protein